MLGLMLERTAWIELLPKLLRKYPFNFGAKQDIVLCMRGGEIQRVSAVSGHELLPPKGAELNPRELLNGHVQHAVLHCIPEGGGMYCFGQVWRGLRSQREAIVAVDEDPKIQPNHFRYWFHRRATGRDATDPCASSPVGALLTVKNSERNRL